MCNAQLASISFVLSFETLLMQTVHLMGVVIGRHAVALPHMFANLYPVSQVVGVCADHAANLAQDANTT